MIIVPITRTGFTSPITTPMAPKPVKDKNEDNSHRYLRLRRWAAVFPVAVSTAKAVHSFGDFSCLVVATLSTNCQRFGQ